MSTAIAYARERLIPGMRVIWLRRANQHIQNGCVKRVTAKAVYVSFSGKVIQFRGSRITRLVQYTPRATLFPEDPDCQCEVCLGPDVRLVG